MQRDFCPGGALAVESADPDRAPERARILIVDDHPANLVALRAVLDSIAYDVLALSPTLLTRLGLDTGKYAWARSKLDDNSAAARART